MGGQDSEPGTNQENLPVVLPRAATLVNDGFEKTFCLLQTIWIQTYYPCDFPRCFEYTGSCFNFCCSREESASTNGHSFIVFSISKRASRVYTTTDHKSCVWLSRTSRRYQTIAGIRIYIYTHIDRRHLAFAKVAQILIYSTPRRNTTTANGRYQTSLQKLQGEVVSNFPQLGSSKRGFLTHRIHVWYIFLHLP